MERHSLVQEFPEHQEKISQLKIENAHFRKLFDEYHEIEHQIHRMNTGEEIVIDEFAHKVKTKFLHLKDELVSYLK